MEKTYAKHATASIFVAIIIRHLAIALLLLWVGGNSRAGGLNHPSDPINITFGGHTNRYIELLHQRNLGHNAATFPRPC